MRRLHRGVVHEPPARRRASAQLARRRVVRARLVGEVSTVSRRPNLDRSVFRPRPTPPYAAAAALNEAFTPVVGGRQEPGQRPDISAELRRAHVPRRRASDIVWLREEASRNGRRATRVPSRRCRPTSGRPSPAWWARRTHTLPDGVVGGRAPAAHIAAAGAPHPHRDAQLRRQRYHLRAPGGARGRRRVGRRCRTWPPR